MRRPALPDGIDNTQAAALLGIEPETLVRIRRRFRHVSQRDEDGEIIWRGDIIRKAVELRTRLGGQRKKLSTERLLEMAVQEVEG